MPAILCGSDSELYYVCMRCVICIHGGLPYRSDPESESCLCTDRYSVRGACQCHALRILSLSHVHVQFVTACVAHVKAMRYIQVHTHTHTYIYTRAYAHMHAYNT